MKKYKTILKHKTKQLSTAVKTADKSSDRTIFLHDDSMLRRFGVQGQDKELRRKLVS
jgi:hypothetical protein